MRVQSAMLCEAASIENGKLFVLGASLAVWRVPAFPATVMPILAGVIEADRDLDEGEAHFTLRVVAADGSELLRGDVAVAITGPDTPGVPWILPLLAPLQILVTQPGPLDVTLGTNAGIESRIPLMVMPAAIG